MHNDACESGDEQEYAYKHNPADILYILKAFGTQCKRRRNSKISGTICAVRIDEIILQI